MRSSLLAVVALVIVVGPATSRSVAQVPAPDRAAVQTSLGKLPLYFVGNRGVYPDEVRYYIQGADKTLYFTDQGVTIALKGKEKGWAVKLDFVGANPDARPEGLKKQAAVFSYFKGPEKDWKAGLPSFSRIVYRDLWPGIDLVYNGSVNKLKYEFVVAPGADPAKIRLQYRGVERLERTDAGALRVTTPEGGFEDAPPVAWQEIDGNRSAVAMAYAVGEGGAFGFDVGGYDESKPLVLDPAILVYCGFIGGTGIDTGRVAVDAAGNAYVAGATKSAAQSFPTTAGPNLTHNGGMDAFVAKVNAQGTALVYCGYIGGRGNDSAVDIAIDAAGNAYVAGWTLSTAASFPVKVGPDLTYNGGSVQGGMGDAFLAKVNAKGTALDYCGYIGGSLDDAGWGIAVDAAGNAYVTGYTASTQADFPVKVGPDLTFNGSPVFYYGDAFVAKVNAKGTALVYCGYIGGSGTDYGMDVAVDAAGNAYVTGQSYSPTVSFPVKVGPDLTHNGSSDAFVAKVNAQGTSLVYCGYIGGSDHDCGWSIAVDTAGNAYVAGDTNSTEVTFPAKVGPDLTHNGGGDAFVAKVDAQGKALDYCGYIGGSKGDAGMGVAVDTAGNAYVTGPTSSTASSFPVKVGPDLTYNGSQDAFVAKVDVKGTALVFCGYIGGSSAEYGWGIAVDGAGNAYAAGDTASTEASFPAKVGPDLTHNGGNSDCFVAKISLTLLEAGGSPRPGGTVNFTLTATDDVGLAYQLGSSFGTGPIKLGTRTLGLSPDKLLEVSVRGVLPTIFVGYAGVIGTNGRATAKINLPNIAGLIGNKIHTAFVTVGPKSPFGIKSISNTYSFTITK